MKISEALQAAVKCQQAGDLVHAEELYREVLKIDARQADALHLLGVVLYQTGHKGQGLEHIREVIRLKPDLPDAYFNLGNMLRDSGHLQEAVEAYRRCLQLRPENAEAEYNLGCTLNDLEQREAAVESFRHAIRYRPDYIKALNNLGNILLALNRPREAVEAFERVLKIKPTYTAGYCNVGSALRQLGRLEEAIVAYRQALELKPNDAAILRSLCVGFNAVGIAYASRGKLDDAIACYRQVLHFWPEFVEAHSNLGNALKDQGKQHEAIACFRLALELNPNFAEVHNNLGVALATLGDVDSALSSYRRALELKPDYAEAHSNLGNALKAQGKLDEAVACYRRAVEIKPEYAESHNNLGIALQEQGKLEQAVACYRQAIEVQPDRAELYNNLGNAFRDQEQAIKSYRRALELKPNFSQARSNLLLTLHYCVGIAPSELASAHAEFEHVHATPLRIVWPRHKNNRDPSRRLRVGFVSGDFGQHPVGSFLTGVLGHLVSESCEVACYSDRLIKDNLTAQIQSDATIWRDIFGWTDQSLAERICADGIDILFDLAGHTAKNRLLAFARKPAPIQVTWMGYVGTTGLKAMDYILADRYEIPAGTEQYYVEKVLWMPDGYVCYDPPKYAPPVSHLPALEHGFVTFGSFNNPSKITPQVIEVWARILAHVSGSRLALKYRGMGDSFMMRRMEDSFASYGIDPQRIECLGRSPHAKLLAEYNRIDVALDPFPYNGGLTTCEALWMGVPVVTCPGETFASRHSLTHLSNLGFTETIADTLEEYVEVAVSLANNLPRLSGIRSGLRERMASSPLCDGKRFAHNLMQILRDVWKKWCNEPTRAVDPRQ